MIILDMDSYYERRAGKTRPNRCDIRFSIAHFALYSIRVGLHKVVKNDILIVVIRLFQHRHPFGIV